MKLHIRIAGAYSHYNKLLPMAMKFRGKANLTVYDGINLCRWNGGRINREVFDSEQQKQAYENLGVNFAFVFSNPTIDLNDPVGNDILERYHREGNSIILQNYDLLEYVRTKFPLYQTVFSITGHPGGVVKDPTNYYQQLERHFDIIVPKLEHNMVIEQYTDDVSKYELLINDDCVYNCPVWRKHFDAIAQKNTEGLIYSSDLESVEECWLPKTIFDPSVGDTKMMKELGIEFGMSLTKEHLKNRMQVGINKFKLSGREFGTHSPTYESYLQSLIEMIDDAKDYMYK